MTTNPPRRRDLSVQDRRVRDVRNLAKQAFRHVRLAERDDDRVRVATPQGYHAFEVVRLGWHRLIVHGDLTPVVFQGGEGGDVAARIHWLAAADVGYVHGKAEGKYGVYDPAAMAEFLRGYLDDLREEGLQEKEYKAEREKLTTLIRRVMHEGLDERAAMEAIHEVDGPLPERSQYVYGAEVVWAHEALKVAHRLLTDAAWDAFLDAPSGAALALYNRRVAGCRRIKSNEGIGV